MVFNCPFCHAKVTARGAQECSSCSRRMVHRCSYCAEDISVLATICKYCGEDVTPAPEQEPVAEAAPPPPVVAEPAADIEFIEPAAEPAKEIEFLGEAKSVAWEDPKRGRLRRWWSTWSSSQFDPNRFWQTTPTDTGHLKAINYAWFVTVQALLFFGLPVMGLLGMAAAAHGEPIETFAVGGTAYLALFPLTWIVTAVGVWGSALLWHLPLKLLGAQGSFQTTVRVVGYNSGAQVWAMLPYLGPIVAGIFSIVLNYHAFRNAHGMSSGKALFAAFLPLILLFGALVALLALAVTGCLDGGSTASC